MQAIDLMAEDGRSHAILEEVVIYGDGKVILKVNDMAGTISDVPSHLSSWQSALLFADIKGHWEYLVYRPERVFVVGEDVTVVPQNSVLSGSYPVTHTSDTSPYCIPPSITRLLDPVFERVVAEFKESINA